MVWWHLTWSCSAYRMARPVNGSGRINVDKEGTISPNRYVQWYHRLDQRSVSLKDQEPLSHITSPFLYLSFLIFNRLRKVSCLDIVIRHPCWNRCCTIDHQTIGGISNILTWAGLGGNSPFPTAHLLSAGGWMEIEAHQMKILPSSFIAVLCWKREMA